MSSYSLYPLYVSRWIVRAIAGNQNPVEKWPPMVMIRARVWGVSPEGQQFNALGVAAQITGGGEDGEVDEVVIGFCVFQGKSLLQTLKATIVMLPQQLLPILDANDNDALPKPL